MLTVALQSAGGLAAQVRTGSCLVVRGVKLLMAMADREWAESRWAWIEPHAGRSSVGMGARRGRAPRSCSLDAERAMSCGLISLRFGSAAAGCHAQHTHGSAQRAAPAMLGKRRTWRC
eukprot:1036894-Pleurochrysis_carterae.AAC.3